MKILLIHNDIIRETGGSEKMCCFFANNFAERGHDVEIATMEDVEGSVIYPLDSRVRLKNLFDPQVPQLNLKPILRYTGINPIKLIYSKYQREKARSYNRKIYKKVGSERGFFEYNIRNRAKVWRDYITESSPDIIILMKLNHVLEITFEQEYKIPIVLSSNERPDVEYMDTFVKKPRFLLEYLQNSYKHLAGCQVLFDSYKAFLPNTFNGNVFTISNPTNRIEEDDIVVHRNDKDKFTFINLTRLDDDFKKQHSVAVEVFSKLAKKYPKWDLHFWGTGNYEPVLRGMIRKLGLEDRIFLNGFTDNPIEKLKNADIFLFPSKYEGLPLALIEAMSVGLPSIGFEICPGTNELIEHGKNGFLAKDSGDMQSLLEKLMKDSELRNRLGKQASKDMRKYDPRLIADKWEELVNAIKK